jgi:hypothetical protein
MHILVSERKYANDAVLNLAQYGHKIGGARLEDLRAELIGF